MTIDKGALKGPSMSRRSVLQSAAALAGAPVLGSLATSALAANTTLNFGAFGGIFEKAAQNLAPTVASKVGIDLALSVGSSQLTLTKLQAGRGNPPFDVVMMTAEAMLLAAEQGLLQTISEKDLPNLSRVQSRLLQPFKVEGGYSTVPMHWKAMGILWRKDLVPFEITSWKDLWRPELKNRISVQNMPTLGGALTLLTANKIFGGTAQDMEPGWKAMKELRPNVREFFAVSSNAMTSLVAGDTWATINTLDLGLPLAAENVVATVPVEGVNYSPEGFAVPKGTAKTADALKFVNFMLEDAQQIAWCTDAKVAPATNVAVPPALQKEIIETDAVLGKLFDIDFLAMGQNMKSWSDRWRREVVG